MLILDDAALLARLVITILHPELLRRLNHGGEQAALFVASE